MKPSDAGLLRAFSKRRDEASFRQLYRRHTPMLYGLALRLCGSAVEAEEITQAAWVRAVEVHDRFRGRSAYSTWVAGILVNCFREHRRARARAPASLEEQQENDSVVSAFPHRMRRSDLIDIEQALRRLSAGYREIVVLHDVGGFTHKEIAAMLGIQEGTSKSQLQRGRAKLRELLTAGDTNQRDRRSTS